MSVTSNVAIEATDAKLPGEYARTESQETFRVLVSRYVDLVHAAARRQVRDPQLAEDVTQAVFLLLTRRAGKVSGQPVVAGWLLVATRNMSANALKREWRLKRREREAANMKREADASSERAIAASVRRWA